MRRRSCAIHSETEEEFMKLAERSENQTGIFYDDKVYNKIWKDQKEECSWKGKAFEDFDFDQSKEYQKEEKLQEKICNHTNLTNIVICDDSVSTCATLLGSKEHSEQEHRSIDYVVHKRETPEGKKVIFKYWVVEAEILDSPLAKIYLSSSHTQYWCSEQPTTVQTARITGCEDLVQTLRESQEQYMSNLP